MMELLGMADLAETSPRKLATGLLKLLDFLRVLMLRPKLVLLDELMAGLSVAELGIVQRTIEHLMREGVQFLIIEHLMGVIRRLSQHLVVMDAGLIVTEGEPEAVIGDPRVVAAYLGDEVAANSPAEAHHA
jgi:branched-chain amino acid transport system permease protein